MKKILISVGILVFKIGLVSGLAEAGLIVEPNSVLVSPEIKLSSNLGVSGDEIKISGSGFGSGEKIQIGCGKLNVVAVTYSSPLGTFATSFFIGDNYEIGVNQVFAVGHSSYLMAQADLRIEPKKEWTFMVYLDGDNNLEECGIDDFVEMAKVGSNENINIVVQFDRAGYDNRYDNWETTKRFYITQGMTPVATNAIEDIGEANMGSSQTVINFGDWA
ncbi:MAG: hypothetical protein AAB116_08180, partial [Candidatus Poribacteria bacterium]